MAFNVTGPVEPNWYHLSMTWPKVTTIVNKQMLYLWTSQKLLTLPHQRLRLKLQLYSNVGNSYQWISSFLSDRHQKAVVDKIMF